MASSSTAETPATTCPTCGAKIRKAGLSLCPYCASPLQLGGAARSSESNPVTERLKRLEQKEEFQEALEWDPPEGRQFQAEQRRARRGTVLLVVAALVFLRAFSAVRADDGAWTALTSVTGIGGCIALAAGIWLILSSASARRRILRVPLLKRAAHVADRRSQTTMKSSRGITHYVFELDFSDGATAEFVWPGRGAAEDLLVNGNTGIAYTRGEELLAFERIKV